MIFDPVEMDVKLDTKDDVWLWRGRLRRYLYGSRPKQCDVCHRPFSRTGFEVHEGIVTRNDAMGWKLPRKAWIFTSLNSVLLCPECHRPQPPTKEWVWELQCGRYGEEAMREWYEGLPWKTGKPPRYFERENG